MSITRYTTVGLFVLLAAIWGLSFVAVRAALPDVPPILLAAFRFDIAAFVLIGYARFTTSRWIPRSRDDWYGVLIGGILFVAVHHALLFAGQRFVTSAVAAVVMCLDPILTAAFARVLLPSERLGLISGLGLTLGLFGVTIIASPSLEMLLRDDVVGVGLVFLSAVAFALGAVLTRRVRTDLPVQTLQGWIMLVGAPILHGTAFLLPTETLARVTWSWTTIAALGYLSIVAAGVGYFIYFELLDRVGPVEINLIAYATPVFAALGGWYILGERLQMRVVIGFGIIVVGFALIKRNAIRAELEGVWGSDVQR